MAEKPDPVISAVGAVHSALKDLDPEERRRVLASVSALLGLPRETSVESGASGTHEPTSGEETPEPAGRVSRRVSLVELMQDKNPSTNAQKITLFAYYRDKHENKPRFAREDLKTYFGLAKESPPSNYDRDFVNAVKNGWIHEEGEDSYITSRGIEVVEAGFVGERKTTKKTTRRKTTGSRKKTTRRKTTGSKKTKRKR